MAIINFSSFVLPGMVLLIVVWGLCAKLPVFDVFLEGAMEGAKAGVKLVGPIVGLMLGIAAFEASGAMEFLSFSLAPFFRLLGVPDALIPLAVLRPISGSGALAVLAGLLSKHGPDTLIGQGSSVIMSSTETTFYVITVYFGALGIKKTRYALPAALIADFSAFLIGCRLAALFF